MKSAFYVTTPIYYVNGTAHIGHAYTTIAADILARHARHLGKETFFATGTDEHGQKIAKAAAEKGIDPLEFTNQIAQTFKTLWEKLHIRYDAFVRTTDPVHKAKVQGFLQKLYEQGDIVRGQYHGWYCVPCESFFPQSQLKEDGSCPDCGRAVEELREDSYFLRLSHYQDWLVQILEKEQIVHPKSKNNEVLGFLKQGLEDLCISRPKTRLEWGIELPFDPDHVTYVWFDALVNYLSVLDMHDKDPELFWPQVTHLIGKDILRPHAVYWPIMLHALGIDVPHRIFVHGWWTIKGEKMSKSKGNVVDPENLIAEFGLDAFRYFLFREVPFGSDGVFSRENVITRINAELSNELGNLVSRSLGMVEKYCKGQVPCLVSTDQDSMEFALQTKAVTVFAAVDEALNEVAYGQALQAIWDYLRELNRYIEQRAPWVLSKDPERQDELDDVMAQLLWSLHAVSWMIYPFMPDCANSLRAKLGQGSLDEALRSENPDLKSVNELSVLPVGAAIVKGDALFPRFEDA